LTYEASPSASLIENAAGYCLQCAAEAFGGEDGAGGQ